MDSTSILPQAKVISISRANASFVVGMIRSVIDKGNKIIFSVSWEDEVLTKECFNLDKSTLSSNIKIL